MKEIYFELLKAFLLRFWMICTRAFVFFCMVFAHYKSPHILFIIGAVISLPLFFVALWRMVETIQLYLNVKPNIANIEKDIIHAQNKEYLKKK